jgi:hypothetical protein
MQTLRPFHFLVFIVVVCFGHHPVLAHCDGLDGPVVKAAQKALAESNVNYALVWVWPGDEAELRRAFDRTLAVRKLNAESRSLADQFFFETLVRLHRAGEGAPYTGIKPAGRDLGPAIPAADRAIESGDVKPVVALLAAKVEHGLRSRFQAVMAKTKYDSKDTEAGRANVQAYVEFIHFVEAVHESAGRETHGHAERAESTAGHHDTEATLK